MVAIFASVLALLSLSGLIRAAPEPIESVMEERTTSKDWGHAPKHNYTFEVREREL
jgi:hypothetical protein